MRPPLRDSSSPAFAFAVFASALAPALLIAGACNRDQPRVFAPPPGPQIAPEIINRPAKLTSVEAPLPASGGAPAGTGRIACDTCHGHRAGGADPAFVHALRANGTLPASPADLKTFHRGLTLKHGELACSSCHVQGRHDVLHLASGAIVPMREAMQLCGQCHGTQMRDFKHGAHGGMSGHWDRSRGPRSRNNCVDCHDPHAPRYVGGNPVLAPRDRPLGPVSQSSSAHGSKEAHP